MSPQDSADDTQWLDALAGRASDSSPASREASALRDALSNIDNAIGTVPNDELAAPRREADLVRRAVDEGLIDRPATRTTTGPTPRRWQLPLAASVLLILAAGVVFQTQRRVEAPEVLRADEAGIVRLTAIDPARLARELLTQLRAAGVQATGYEALDVHGIDADLPLPLSPAVERILAAHGIPAPADGVLRVEIRKPQ